MVTEAHATDRTQPTARTCPFDPPPGYRTLRENDPVAEVTLPDGVRGRLVTGYEEVRAVPADPRLSSRRRPFRTGGATAGDMPVPPPAPGMFITMDPPEHTRFRRLLTGQSTVRRTALQDLELAGHRIPAGCTVVACLPARPCPAARAFGPRRGRRWSLPRAGHRGGAVAMAHIAVVGASAAGLTAADTLRREGFTNTLTMVGDELRPPCGRPPLSKQVLAGDWEPRKATLRQDVDLQRM
ncbi:hypothetical protein [Streptomyces sp. NPDC004296]|uniref:hypothetical protein n=1 Tax=Streptomyces sp. NPDC004296 TaxID=3364697 RepID=UPI00369676EF